MGLAWRVATRITAEDLAEMLREDGFRRFGDARARAQGIELLSDNGSEYTSHRFWPRVRAMGVIPWQTTRRSPESNSMAEAFFGSFKQDDVYQTCLETWEDVGRQLPAWIEQKEGYQFSTNCPKIRWGSTFSFPIRDCVPGTCWMEPSGHDQKGALGGHPTTFAFTNVLFPTSWRRTSRIKGFTEPN